VEGAVLDLKAGRASDVAPSSPLPTARSASGRRSRGGGKTREQRCWVHKTANVLKQLPKSIQRNA